MFASSIAALEQLRPVTRIWDTFAGLNQARYVLLETTTALSKNAFQSDPADRPERVKDT